MQNHRDYLESIRLEAADYANPTGSGQAYSFASRPCSSIHANTIPLASSAGVVCLRAASALKADSTSLGNRKPMVLPSEFGAAKKVPLGDLRLVFIEQFNTTMVTPLVYRSHPGISMDVSGKIVVN